MTSNLSIQSKYRYHSLMNMKTILTNKRFFTTAVLYVALTGCALPTSEGRRSDQILSDTHSPREWQQHLLTTKLPSILLLGEQHDAPEHQQWERDTIHALTQRQQLTAVVLEMAEHGTSTHNLPITASEENVRNALHWNDAGWPWKTYGPVVMTAVTHGVPVYGGNLPRTEMPSVMKQPDWDSHLSIDNWRQQQEAIRVGHCNLLPQTQIAPMARIQLAKDARLAQTAIALVQPEKTVVIIAGRGHVLRNIGIPTWLPQQLSYRIAIGQAGKQEQASIEERDWVVQTPDVPFKDHCDSLRQRWGQQSMQNSK